MLLNLENNVFGLQGVSCNPLHYPWCMASNTAISYRKAWRWTLQRVKSPQRLSRTIPSFDIGVAERCSLSVAKGLELNSARPTSVLILAVEKPKSKYEQVSETTIIFWTCGNFTRGGGGQPALRKTNKNCEEDNLTNRQPVGFQLHVFFLSSNQEVTLVKGDYCESDAYKRSTSTDSDSFLLSLFTTAMVQNISW